MLNIMLNCWLNFFMDNPIIVYSYKCNEIVGCIGEAQYNVCC